MQRTNTRFRTLSFPTSSYFGNFGRVITNDYNSAVAFPRAQDLCALQHVLSIGFSPTQRDFYLRQRLAGHCKQVPKHKKPECRASRGNGRWCEFGAAHELLNVLLVNLVDVLELAHEALERASATSGKRALQVFINTPPKSTSRKRIATGLSMKGAGRRPGVKPRELTSKASMHSVRKASGRRRSRRLRSTVSGARVLRPGFLPCEIS